MQTQLVSKIMHQILAVILRLFNYGKDSFIVFVPGAFDPSAVPRALSALEWANSAQLHFMTFPSMCDRPRPRVMPKPRVRTKFLVNCKPVKPIFIVMPSRVGRTQLIQLTVTGSQSLFKLFKLKTNKNCWKDITNFWIKINNLVSLYSTRKNQLTDKQSCGAYSTLR